MKSIRQETPPLPELPAREEVMAAVAAALAPGGSGLENRGLDIWRICNGRHPWEEGGNTGWEARLRIWPAEPLREMLNQLADWWDESARDAVRECPPPETGIPQTISRTGRPRFRRTLWWKHQAEGQVLMPGHQPAAVMVQAGISWRGQADAREAVWPLDLPGVTGRITAALGEILGENWALDRERTTHSAKPGRRKE